MNIIRWIVNLFGKKRESTSPTLSQTLHSTHVKAPVADIQDEEAAGLNFKTAIEAHQKWKARLKDVIEGNSSETLDVSMICRDDQCLLGKWIHGDGGKQFGVLNEFIELQKNHANFHKCAGHVLELAQAGKKSEADQNLSVGPYAQVSLQVVMNLAAMYTKVKKK
ncbi:MAG: CZB domain-containing protein [Methyloglobulus sp.]|nr:CZB domain-containing protein [Methyloglobulus sp.]